MGRLVAATAASVGPVGLYEFQDADLDRTLTTGSVTTLPQFRSHAAAQEPAGTSWFSGFTPLTAPPLMVKLLVYSVTGFFFEPLACWRANTGPFLALASTSRTIGRQRISRPAICRKTELLSCGPAAICAPSRVCGPRWVFLPTLMIVRWFLSRI